MAAQPPGSAGDGVARNTLFAFLVQLSTSAFTAILTIVLVRVLEPEGYGIFALALSLGGIVLILSDFGLSQSSARFIAERRGDSTAVAGVLATALRLKLFLSALSSVVLIALARPIADAYGVPELVWPLRLIALAVFGQSLMHFFTSAFVAQARIRVNLRIVFSEAVVETGASIVLVVLGAGAAGAAGGRAVGYLVGGALGFLVAVRHVRERLLRRRFESETAKRLGGYASALVVVDGAYTLFGALDALVIGAVLGPAAVGLYRAPGRLITFLHYPGLAVASGVAPRVARHAEHGRDLATFERALRLLVLAQGILIAPVVVWAEPIVRLLLGTDYLPSTNVLRAFAPFIFLSGIAPLASLAVNYLGEARRRVPIAFAVAGLHFAMLIVLVPRYGIVAGAVASSVAYGVYVPAHLWVFRRLVGLAVRPLLLAVTQALVAAAAMGGLLYALGTERLSLAAWLTGLALGPAVYVGALVLTGAIDRADLRFARSRLRRA